MHFICVPTAWKVTAYISPIRMSKLNNKQWFKGQVCSSFTALTISRYSNLTSLTTMYLIPRFSQSASPKTGQLPSLFLHATSAKERPWRESSPCTTLSCTYTQTSDMDATSLGTLSVANNRLSPRESSSIYLARGRSPLLAEKGCQTA